MGWTSGQRQRLGVEKSILKKHFSSCVTWISPRRNSKIDVFVKCNSGTQHTLRVYIPHDFPNSCPNVVFKEPESRISDFQDQRSSHTYPLRNHEGYLRIRHCDERDWTCENTLYQVLVKGLLWLEAYEGHLRTGNSIDSFLAWKKY